MGPWVLDNLLELVPWPATRSPELLGLLNFVLYMPGLLITPMFSASLSANNVRLRTMLVLAGGLAVALVLALCAALGWLATPLILALALARGVLNGMEQPARQMLLATSVSHQEQIGGAVALNTVVFQVARMFGPALAALMFSSVGAGWGFVFSGAAVAVMIGCVLQVRPVAPFTGATAAAGRGGLRGALDFVRADRFGSLFLPVTACMALCTGGYQTLVPVLSDSVYGDTARWTSLFFAAAGAGALVAALLMSTHLARGARRRLLVPVPWLLALALLGLGTSRLAPLSLLCFAVIGFGMTTVAVGGGSVLHRNVPPDSRNGLIALLLLAFNGVIALVQVPAGLLAGRFGVLSAFRVMGGCMLALLLLLFVRRWCLLKRLEVDCERV